MSESALLPELLGFMPQIVLDDIINYANETSYQGVDAAEEFIRRWLDDREARLGVDSELRREIDSGLAAFETLLDSNADLAFDSFEIWSLRNVFSIPRDLDIVAPHHRGLDLTIPEGKETALLTEIEELRSKVNNMQQYHSRIRKANHRAAVRLAQAQARLERLSFLATPGEPVRSVSTSVQTLLQKMATLPQPPPRASQQESNSRRAWETSRAGYVEWAVERLVKDTGIYDDGTTTNDLVKAQAIGPPKNLRAGLREVAKEGARDMDVDATSD